MWELLIFFGAFGSSVVEPMAVPQQSPLAYFQTSSYPVHTGDSVAPVLSKNDAVSYFVYDITAGKTLFDVFSSRSQNIASLSKLMTVFLILENHQMNEPVNIPLEATEVEGAKADLYAKEQLTVKTLLESVLISSANDSALALAIFHSGSESKFVEEMNNKAKELGFSSVLFHNATGLDVLTQEDSSSGMLGNKMSAREISLLSRMLLKYDFVRETVKEDLFEGTSIDGRFSHEKKTTNQLLNSSLNILGFKTGFTYLAGECFVALSEHDGNEILTIVLGSEDRFGDTRKLLSWIYNEYEWR